MLARIRNYFNIPVYEDPEQNVQAQNLGIILRVLMVLTVLFLLYAIFSPPLAQMIVAIVAVAFEFGLLAMLKNRQLQLAGILFIGFLWVAILAEVILYGGIRDTGFASFIIVIAIANLTLGVRAGIISTVITILAGIGLSIAENYRVLPPTIISPIESILISYVITFTAVTLLLYLAVRSVTSTARKALESERQQKEINAQLEKSQADLREQETTLEQRNTVLQTATDLSRITSQATSEESLLEEAVQLLSQRLKLDHVGIFLLSQTEGALILQVFNSPEGKKLMASGYQLKVARSRFITTAYGGGLLHYQVGNRDYHIERPRQIQNTNINLSIPLISGDRLLGLVNIQSAQSESHELDQKTLQTIADQIALSLVNLQLVDQLQARVQEVSLLAGQTVQNAWEQLQGGKNFGYYYDQLQVMPSDEALPAKILEQLLAGKSVSYITSEENPRSRLIAPILLRGLVIGIIGYEDNDVHHNWLAEERSLLETISSRVSQALENTRLVAEAQQRAAKERTIGEISAKIGASIDIDNILQTAAREMSSVLPGAEVIIQFQSEGTEKKGS